MNTSIAADLAKSIGRPAGSFSVVGLGGTEIEVHVLLLRVKENLPQLLLDRGVAIVQKEFKSNKFFPAIIQLFDQLDRYVQVDIPLLSGIRQFRENIRLLENLMELSDFYQLLVCLSDRMLEVVAFAEKNGHGDLGKTFKDIHTYVVKDKKKSAELRLGPKQIYLG